MTKWFDTNHHFLVRLAKSHALGFDRLSLLPNVITAYQRILKKLRDMGIEWVQMDEPALALDLEPAWLNASENAYAALALSGVKILLATYFNSVAEPASSFSLMHVPVSLDSEINFDAEVARWLAFATEKLSEIRASLLGLSNDEKEIADLLRASDEVQTRRRKSKRVINQVVQNRVSAVDAKMADRRSPFVNRIAV